jgi:hypothetical protein
MQDNAPINQISIEFGAFGKSFVELVKNLKKAGLDADNSALTAISLAESFLNYANAKKFADTMDASFSVIPTEE